MSTILKNADHFWKLMYFCANDKILLDKVDKKWYYYDKL